MDSPDWLLLNRKVRFGDCDSAGVIHFHNLLRWAHESWEESIEIYGFSFKEIFPSNLSNSKVIFPIVNCEANFYSPIRLGDHLTIKIYPKKIYNYLFSVNTLFMIKESKVAEGKVTHCSIDFDSRKKVQLPHKLELWIEASNIKSNIQEC